MRARSARPCSGLLEARDRGRARVRTAQQPESCTMYVSVVGVPVVARLSPLACVTARGKCFARVYNRNSHFGTRVVVVPGWCWDLGCQSVDFCDLCEARDFCAELAVAPRGRTYSRFRPTTLDRAHHHRVRTFYRVRDALDHHRGGDKSAFSTRCDGGVQHQPSRLPAPRRGSPSGNVGRLDTARPQTSHVALAFCQLSPRSRCCSRSRRASPVLHAHTCAARPPRGSEALFGGAGK